MAVRGPHAHQGDLSSVSPLGIFIYVPIRIKVNDDGDNVGGDVDNDDDDKGNHLQNIEIH